MKRPLAIFGLGLYLSMFGMTLVAPAWILPLALVLLAAGAVNLVYARKCPVNQEQSKAASLLIAAALVSVTIFSLYNQLALRPILVMRDTRQAVRARVVDVRPGYGGDTVHARLQILSVEGEKCRPFSLWIYGMAPVEIGDGLQVDISFYDFGSKTRQSIQFAKGQFIRGVLASEPVVTGPSHSFFTRMRALQYAASQNVLDRLPQNLSGIAAAMALGDRRFVSQEASQAYRSAGLTHLLVVSGLHMSMLFALVHQLALGTCRRKEIASLLCMALLVLFMAFTGFSVSVVRSGVMWMMIFAAGMLGRRADVYTSMALAAAALLLENPYASRDVGLMLSFTATLGALQSGRVSQWLHDQMAAKNQKWALSSQKLGFVVTPLCVTLATLPVLAGAGLGVSLLSVPMNILALPFVPLFVVGGFAMALPPVFLLGAIGDFSALVMGLVLRLFEVVTGLCTRVPGAWLPISGLYALVVIAILYLFAYAGVRTRRYRFYGLSAALALGVAMGLHLALSAGTVRVFVAGSGGNTSLLVEQQGQSVILYRHRLSEYSLVQMTQQYGVKECRLLVDLRRKPETAAYVDELSPREVVLAAEDIWVHRVYAPLEDVKVIVAKQAKGNTAFVDVQGYTIALCTGSPNLQIYPQADLFVTGASPVEPCARAVLCGSKQQDPPQTGVQYYQNEGNAVLWFRPGKSLIYREVQDLNGD